MLFKQFSVYLFGYFQILTYICRALVYKPMHQLGHSKVSFAKPLFNNHLYFPDLGIILNSKSMIKFKWYALTLLLLQVIATGCSSSIPEKSQTRETHIIGDAWNRVVEIPIDDSLEIVSFIPQIVGQYLVVIDHQTRDKFLHIFNKDSFDYITSLWAKGHGHNEVFKIDSQVIPIGDKNEFYIMADNLKFFKINIDSVLRDKDYQPERLFDWGDKAQKIFPNDCTLIDDSTAIVSVIEPTGNSGFDQSVGKFHLKSGKIDKFDYVHPLASHRRSTVTASAAQRVCFEFYRNRDLLTMYDFDGKVLCNITGPQWTGKDDSNELSYFSEAVVAQNHVIVSYSGEDYMTSMTNKFLVYDTQGNYVKTLDLNGHSIQRICYDPSNNRLIFASDDYTLAYLPLDEYLR